MNKVLHSSTSNDWNTPQGLLDTITLMGAIGLDPCSNERSIVNAKLQWTEKEDGLSHSWQNHGLVYVNPPYGKAIPDWIEKCSKEGALGAEIIALTPARTDTRWFHNHAITAIRICLLKGRLRFIGAKGSAPFPSMLLYWGQRAPSFTLHVHPLGAVLNPFMLANQGQT